MKQPLLWSVLFSLGLVIGCGGGGEYQTADKLPQTADHDHDHGHDHGHGHDHDHAALGPHRGVLVELGDDEYHAEFVVDQQSNKLKLFLLGPDGKIQTTSSAPQAVIKLESGAELILKPVEGQLENLFDTYELVDEAVVQQILKDEFLHGTLLLDVGDKEYKADVDAHFHPDHGRADMPAKEQLAPATSPTTDGAAEAAAVEPGK